MPGFNIPNFLLGNCEDGTTGTQNDIVQSQLPNNLETARNNRFRIRIEIAERSSEFSRRLMIGMPPEGYTRPLDKQYFELACQSISRPSPRAIVERVWNYVNYINVPLRQEYDTITAVFYELFDDTAARVVDYSDPDAPVTSMYTSITAKQIFSWWTNTVFDVYELKTHHPIARKSTVVIEQLDGYGKKVWSYKLFNCYPMTLIPGTLDNKSGDIAKYEIMLSYDACSQE